MDIFAQLLHKALIVTGIISLPILALATLIGTFVAVIQAATSIQEQSLGVLPKILAVLGVIVMAGHSGMGLLEQFFREVLAAIPAIVSSTPS